VWRDFEIAYRHGRTPYRIRVENPHSLCRGVAEVTLDGVAQPDIEVGLVDDGHPHEVHVVMGEKIEVPEPPAVKSEPPAVAGG
jgi:cyclic beta-1,2-glucan synthetase